MPFQAGKGVKDPYEAQQIVVKRTREVGKDRLVFHWPLELNGKPRSNYDPALEGKKAVTTNNEWINGKYAEPLTVDKDPNGKIYVSSVNKDGTRKERVRLYEPEKVSEKPGPDGHYDVQE
jgi:hypothetical protein